MRRGHNIVDEALSVLYNGDIIGPTMLSYLVGWFVCLSVTIVTGDLYCLWNRLHCLQGGIQTCSPNDLINPSIVLF